MAILTQKKNYKTGDAVTAAVINDTIETAIWAADVAKNIEQRADNNEFKGDKGDTGDKGDKPAHEWQNTVLRFENPNGTWGNYVNLKGEPGDTSAAEALAQAAAGSAAAAQAAAEQAAETGGTVVLAENMVMPTVSIINNLNETESGNVLDARQGKILNENKANGYSVRRLLMGTGGGAPAGLPINYFEPYISIKAGDIAISEDGFVHLIERATNGYFDLASTSINIKSHLYQHNIRIGFSPSGYASLTVYFMTTIITTISEEFTLSMLGDYLYYGGFTTLYNLLSVSGLAHDDPSYIGHQAIGLFYTHSPEGIRVVDGRLNWVLLGEHSPTTTLYDTVIQI